jgi:hypothetical protein
MDGQGGAQLAVGRLGSLRLVGHAIEARMTEHITRTTPYLRYLSADGEGYRTMVLEAVVGWRGGHYPSDVVYGTRNSRAGVSSCIAAEPKDPMAVGFAQ